MRDVDPAVSERMALVRGRDTKPELAARCLLSARKVRYRLHRRDLPGRPDIYIARLRLAVFVNGCFWHRHNCFNGRRVPKTNVPWWTEKLRRNAERDRTARERLAEIGIVVLDVWECEPKRLPSLCDDIARSYHAQPVKDAMRSLRRNVARKVAKAEGNRR